MNKGVGFGNKFMFSLYLNNTKREKPKVIQ